MIVKEHTTTEESPTMIIDHLSLSALVPHGDPSHESRFREEYLTKSESAAEAEHTHPEMVRRSRIIRAQAVARVGRYFA